MGNWLRILPLAAGSVVLMGNHNQMYNYWEPAYLTEMYSDATRQVVVGRIVPECSEPIQYNLEGTYTNYQYTELVGHCTEAGLIVDYH